MRGLSALWYDSDVMAFTSLTCAGCGHALDGSVAFRLRSARGALDKCLACAVRHGSILKRSHQVALVVGTVLTAINQGDLLISGDWPPALAWTIPLTYLVPRAVATTGALGESRLTGPLDAP
jgi:hypothetical protein